MVLTTIEGVLCIKVRGVWYFEAEGRKALADLFNERKEMLKYAMRKQA